jgi:predicted nucleotidyltransferase
VAGKRFSVDADRLAAVAMRWGISRLSLFGSALGEDFGEDSDVDVLVEFSPQTHYSLFDLVDLKQELESVFRRSVDLFEPAALTNPYRRKHIMATARVLYAA